MKKGKLPMNAICTERLSKTYKGHGGFRHASFVVEQGQVFGCLGPNGAGKSTLVKTLLGFLQPTSGKATVLGQPLGDKNVRRRIGYLPELFRYHPWLSGEALLRLHGQLHRMPEEQIRRRIPRVLEQVGMLGQEKKKVADYSKGMQQRIGLGCALINDPELIFLDEPTSALDPIGRRQIRDLLLELKSQGKTIFLNSHLLGEVEAVCDALLIINRGKVIVQGTWEQLQAGNLFGRIRLLDENGQALSRFTTLLESRPHWQKAMTIVQNFPEVTLRIALKTREYMSLWLTQLACEGFLFLEVTVEKPSLE
jgi:ABC-2 type transport system ATP-binding protein